MAQIKIEMSDTNLTNNIDSLHETNYIENDPQFVAKHRDPIISVVPKLFQEPIGIVPKMLWDSICIPSLIYSNVQWADCKLCPNITFWCKLRPKYLMELSESRPIKVKISNSIFLSHFIRLRTVDITILILVWLKICFFRRGIYIRKNVLLFMFVKMYCYLNYIGDKNLNKSGRTNSN